MLHGIGAEYPCIGDQDIINKAFKEFRFSDVVSVLNIVYDNGLVQVVQILQHGWFIR